jgi:hypothetical protein
MFSICRACLSWQAGERRPRGFDDLIDDLIDVHRVLRQSRTSTMAASLRGAPPPRLSLLSRPSKDASSSVPDVAKVVTAKDAWDAIAKASSAERRRVTGVVLCSCALIVLCVVILVIAQALGIAEQFPDVEAYYPGYTQRGGCERQSFFGNVPGPVPSDYGDCSTTVAQGSANDENYPVSPPFGLTRSAASQRVFSNVITDDSGDTVFVSATALSGSVLADSLGTELWLSRYGIDGRQGSHVPLVQVRPIIAAERAAAETPPASDEARSLEPYLALAQVAMEPGSRTVLVAVRGSVSSRPGPDASMTPVSFLAVLATSSTNEMACLPGASVDFVAQQGAPSRAQLSQGCLPNTPPPPVTRMGNPGDWFRPVRLLVADCVHAEQSNSSSPTSQATPAKWERLCSSQSGNAAYNAWFSVFALGPRYDVLELRLFRVELSRSDVSSRWSATSMRLVWAQEGIVSGSVPVFWPFPVSQIASISLSRNASIVLVSAPVPSSDKPVLNSSQIPAGLPSPPTMDLVAINVTTGRNVWQLSKVYSDIVGVVSNALFDLGGSAWVMLVAAQTNEPDPTLPAISEPLGQNQSVYYLMVSLDATTGIHRQTVKSAVFNPSRATVAYTHPTFQIASSTNFVSYCEQLYSFDVNVTAVSQVIQRNTPFWLTSGGGWGTISLGDGTLAQHEGNSGSGIQVACVGDLVATDKSVYAPVALAVEPYGPGMDGMSLPNNTVADVSIRGEIVWGSTTNSELFVDSLGSVQYPGLWVPGEPPGADMLKDSAFYGTESRIHIAFSQGRRLVSKLNSPVPHSLAVGMGANDSVPDMIRTRECGVQPQQLVTLYTFMTVGLILSILLRCCWGLRWATVFTLKIGQPPSEEDEHDAPVVRTSDQEASRLDQETHCWNGCRFNRMEDQCQVQCCRVQCRAPGNCEAFLRSQEEGIEQDAARERYQERRGDSHVVRKGLFRPSKKSELQLVQTGPEAGLVFTSLGVPVRIRSRPYLRCSLSPIKVKSIRPSGGDAFDAILPAGFVCCCLDVRLSSLGRLMQGGSRGPSFDATPWHLLTMIHVVVLAIIMAWTTMQTGWAVSDFTQQLASPQAFFYSYLVNAVSDPDGLCQSATEGACFCSGSSSSHSLLDVTDPRSWESLANTAPGGAHCPCANSTACSRACDIVLPETGNCAAQAFPYECTCSGGGNGLNDCDVLSMVVLTSRIPAANSPLMKALTDCSSQYDQLSELASVGAIIVVILAMLLPLAHCDAHEPSSSRRGGKQNKMFKDPDEPKPSSTPTSSTMPFDPEVVSPMRRLGRDRQQSTVDSRALDRLQAEDSSPRPEASHADADPEVPVIPATESVTGVPRTFAVDECSDSLELSDTRALYHSWYQFPLPQMTRSQVKSVEQSEERALLEEGALFDCRDVDQLPPAEALRDYLPPDALIEGTGTTVRSRAGVTTMGLATASVTMGLATTVRKENAELVEVAGDKSRGRHCLQVMFAFIVAMALLGFVMASMYPLLAKGRACTSDGSNVDLPIDLPIDPSKSLILRQLTACSFSSEWLELDPEGAVARVSRVSLYAVVVAFGVLVLDACAAGTHMICRLRNASAVHPRQLALMAERAADSGRVTCEQHMDACMDTASWVVVWPVFLVGRALTACRDCCCGSAPPEPVHFGERSASSRSLLTEEGSAGGTPVRARGGCPTCRWGYPLMFCCSPQWECARWCYVWQPWICGCGCCTIVCCFNPRVYRDYLAAPPPAPAALRDQHDYEVKKLALTFAGAARQAVVR